MLEILKLPLSALQSLPRLVKDMVRVLLRDMHTEQTLSSSRCM